MLENRVRQLVFVFRPAMFSLISMFVVEIIGWGVEGERDWSWILTWYKGSIYTQISWYRLVSNKVHLAKVPLIYCDLRCKIQAAFLRLLPLRTMSRFWGLLASLVCVTLFASSLILLNFNFEYLDLILWFGFENLTSRKLLVYALIQWVGTLENKCNLNKLSKNRL